MVGAADCHKGGNITIWSSNTHGVGCVWLGARPTTESPWRPSPLPSREGEPGELEKYSPTLDVTLPLVGREGRG